MYLAIPKENINGETRVAATPGTVKDLIKSGMEVYVESKAGQNSYFSDQEYKDAGANIVESEDELLSQADVIIKVLAPSNEQVLKIKPNAAIISFCQTTRELDAVKAMRDEANEKKKAQAKAKGKATARQGVYEPGQFARTLVTSGDSDYRYPDLGTFRTMLKEWGPPSRETGCSTCAASRGTSTRARSSTRCGARLVLLVASSGTKTARTTCGAGMLSWHTIPEPTRWRKCTPHWKLTDFFSRTLLISTHFDH